MDISRLVAQKFNDLSDPSQGFAQPWLRYLLGVHSVEDGLCAVTENALAEGRDTLTRLLYTGALKPDGQARELVYPAFELDLAMMVEAQELAKQIEVSRHAKSFANTVTFVGTDYWKVDSFAEQRKREGAWSRYAGQRRLIKDQAPYVAVGDVRRHYPSVGWKALISGLSGATGWSKPEIAAALRLYGHLRMSLQGRHEGLPVGVDLSGVVGTAMLWELDELLANSGLPDLSARWVDDMAVGVKSRRHGDEILHELAQGPLRELGLDLHPAKSETLLADSWEFREVSYVELVDESASPIIRLTGAIESLQSAPDAPLPRARARGVLQALEDESLPADLEAMQIAGHAHLLIQAGRDVRSRISRLVGPEWPADITDQFLGSLLGADPGSAWEADCARQLPYLLRQRVGIGRQGRRALRGLVVDRNRGEHMRVTAAWSLAERTGEFEKGIIDRLHEGSVVGARGLLAAHHRAGGRFQNWHRRQALIEPIA